MEKSTKSSSDQTSEFFFDGQLGSSSKTWKDLIEELAAEKYYNPYCFTSDYWEIFKKIILSLLLEEHIVLLDADFTDEELIKLTGHSDFSSFHRKLNIPPINLNTGKNTLIEKLRSTGENWKMSLFTSGTTGVPKKITHGFKSLTRFVRVAPKHQRSIWGFAYHPTHMAGVQVFLQALLNGNKLIRLFGLQPNEIHKQLSDHQITHLSATPTFYRMLLPSDSVYPAMLKITSGGEKFNNQTFDRISGLFPEAEITNVYASTEAGTLFASRDDSFSVKEEFGDLVKFKGNEILIHRSLMGERDSDADDWYATGDLIQVIQEDPLKFIFVSRRNEMINVGGFKVNPNEVEEVLNGIEGIRMSSVYAKKNSVLGNLLCAEVVREGDQITEAGLRKDLQDKLQEFKIPRMIRFVEEISKTRTGKQKRTQ